MTKVLVVDDHPLFRQGLIKLMESSKQIQVIGETGEGTEVFDLIRTHEPDIVILDISMPGADGLEIMQQARFHNLPVKFIVLTMYKEDEYLDRALDLDVNGYILKENAISDLLQCIEAVAKGRFYISPLLSENLIKHRQSLKNTLNEIPGLENLTNMEIRILRLIAENKTSKEIASQLHISYRTAQNHRANISQKLGLSGYNKLLQFALEHKPEIRMLNGV